MQRPHPLLSVLTWELRRFRASRLFGVQARCFFVLLLFVLWLEREPDTFGLNTLVIFFVAGTSAWGLLESLPIGLLMLLVFLLPFVNADGVTRDLQRRIHELLMTTTLPTRAYVWERYLMGLLVSLGLAPHKYRFLRVQPTRQRSGGGSCLVGSGGRMGGVTTSGHGSGTIFPKGNASAFSRVANNTSRPRCKQLSRRAGCWVCSRFLRGPAEWAWGKDC